MPVLILAGEEDFTLYRHLDELKTKLVDPSWLSFNYARHDNPPPQDVVDLAGALPFGPGNKVIVLDRIDWFSKKRAGKNDDTAAGAKKAAKAAARETVDEDSLGEALASVHPNTHLIFISTSNFDSTLRLSKLVSKHGQLEKFEKTKFFPGSPIPATIDNWCQKEAKHFGATIDSEAISYLVDGLDANLRQISSEIEKVAIYIMPKTHISLDAVKNLSPHHSHIFGVVDLWFGGKTAEAFSALKELQAKQNNMATIATLQTFISKWVEIKALAKYHNEKAAFGPGVQRREIPEADLAKTIAAEMKMHPFALQNDMRRLRSVSLEFLEDKRIELTHLEHLVKTGQIHDTHALELFFSREKKAAGKK